MAGTAGKCSPAGWRWRWRWRRRQVVSGTHSAAAGNGQHRARGKEAGPRPHHGVPVLRVVTVFRDDGFICTNRRRGKGGGARAGSARRAAGWAGAWQTSAAAAILPRKLHRPEVRCLCAPTRVTARNAELQRRNAPRRLCMGTHPAFPRGPPPAARLLPRQSSPRHLASNASVARNLRAIRQRGSARTHGTALRSQAGHRGLPTRAGWVVRRERVVRAQRTAKPGAPSAPPPGAQPPNHQTNTQPKNRLTCVFIREAFAKVPQRLADHPGKLPVRAARICQYLHASSVQQPQNGKPFQTCTCHATHVAGRGRHAQGHGVKTTEKRHRFHPTAQAPHTRTTTHR